MIQFQLSNSTSRPWPVLLAALMLIALVRTRAAESVSCVHCPEYEVLSAQEKEAIIMGKIVATEYDELPAGRKLCDPVDRFNEAIDDGIDMSHFFDRFSDSRPLDMARVNHFEGILAAVKFEADEASPFTGIFKGAEHGVVRWSTTGTPPLGDNLLSEYLLGTFAGSMAIKL